MKENENEYPVENERPYLTIKEWQPGERPREKLMERGVSALSDAELLAIIIHSGSQKATALDIAKGMLKEHKNFRELSKRDLNEMTMFKGIGEARAITILAAFEIGRRMNAHPDEDEYRIQSPEDVARIYIPKLRDMNHEVFYALLLNSSGKILREAEISKGTVNASLVHPREIFRAAALALATSIVLLHNHPGGSPMPSAEDRAVTKQIVEAGKLMDIPVQDHIIICGDSYVSFSEKGWL